MKLIKVTLLVLLLVAGAVAARTTESELLLVQLEGAVIGGSIKLPAELCHEDWKAYAIALGPRTPGSEKWATRGRVVWALRDRQRQRVVVAEVKEKENDLIVWSPVPLTGKGWMITVETSAPPTVVLTAKPEVDLDFGTQVDRAAVGQSVSLPSVRPASWVEVRLRTGNNDWLPGRVGALACEAEGRRVSFVVIRTGEAEGQFEALVWMRESEVPQLAGRGWREVRPLSDLVVANPLSPLLPTKGQLDSARLVSQKSPVMGQPDGQTVADWLYPADQLARLPVGARIADMPPGLGEGGAPEGWFGLRLGGFKSEQLDRVAPGVITELVDATGQCAPIRGVIIAVDRPNRMVRFWAVGRPDAKVNWELRLP